MQKVSSYLSIVLTVLVGILFYLHFSNSPAESTVPKTPSGTPKPVVSKTAKIVFFDIDTLNRYYKYRKDLEAQISRDSASKVKVLVSQDAEVKKKYQEYERMAYRMTEDQLKAAQQDLMQRQQKLEAELNRLEVEHAKELDKLNEKFVNKLTEFFNRYRKEKGYDYTLMKGPASSVVSADDSLNITYDLIERLNAEYKK